jgi:hypothetical protein
MRYISIFLILLAIPISSFGQESKFCSGEYHKKVMLLYQNRTPETAKIVFQILSCGGQISKESKRGQFVALVGGYMRENPALIDYLHASANSVESVDAAKIFLDGLWFCASKECKNKLKERPFQLPLKDVNNLLAETPPDPFSMPMENSATLDFLWGCFFGTGDTKIVERFINILDANWEELNSSEPMGVRKRMVLSAAHWSLVSIASQQGLVKKVLEDDKRAVAKELLKELNLTQ